MNSIMRFTRTFVRVSSPAPATKVVVEKRVSQGIYIPTALVGGYGTKAYLAPGHYPSIKDAVRAIRFADMPIISYGRDSRNWFCAIVRHPCGQDFYFGISFEQNRIACCGPVPPREVQVRETVTVSSTTHHRRMRHW